MDTINLNGIEYVRKDKIAKLEKQKKTAERDKLQAEKELQVIKDIIGKSFSELKNLIDDDVLHVEQNATLSWTNKRANDKYVVCNSHKTIPYIKLMDKDGNFYNKYNRQLAFSVTDVIKVQQDITDDMTVAQARIIRKKLDLSAYFFGVIVYNIQQHTFDKYIEEFQSSLAPKIQKVSLPPQNNPEKREEGGYYSI